MPDRPSAPAGAPRIETARLVLRGHRVDDFADSLAMWSDPLVTRHIGGRPSTAEECWARLLRYFGLWPALGFGYWAIEEKSTGRFVGEAGLADFRRATEPPLQWPEAGWALAPAFFGRGYASEAVSAVLAWADGQGIGPVCCIIDPANAASLRLAAGAGFVRREDVRYRDGSTTLHLRENARR